MARAVLIGGLEFLSFLIVTINFRACAKGKIALTCSTDAMLATLSFVLTRQIVNANTRAEMICYVIGACTGSVLGMRITRGWDHV
jgi:uncharacterized protein YebE (UPF0316 family)